MARNTLSWISIIILIVWKREKSPLRNQRIIWEDQVRVWIHILVSLPKGLTRIKSRCAITGITKQDYRKFLKKFNNSPYLGYKSKHVHNEQHEAYLLLIKQIINIIKIKRHVWICTKFIKSGGSKINLETSKK